MTNPNAFPDGFPKVGEFVDEAITLESRFPQIVMPRDSMWPLRIHDEATKEAAAEALPQLVATLSEPIAPASETQLRALFATNPHDRRHGWTARKTDEGLTYSTAAYVTPEDAHGRSQIFYGVNYTFDTNGRLVKREYIEDERSYDRGRPNFQEYLKYDDYGFLTERLTWAEYETSMTDRFEYTTDENGRKVPAKMARTQKVKADDYSVSDSDPMTVDLANYEEWLATNPNGFAALTREQLAPNEFEVKDFEVTENRRGILFAHPEQLEHALVMYGDGSYPTPGDKTALEHNDEAFTEAHGPLGGALFSLMARSGDMREFVKNRITDKVQRKWEDVQQSDDTNAEEFAGFDFDYDGAGHFHKTGGDITITKSGIELKMHAAYVGDGVEDQLASALQTKRGLRSASITVPVNQTEREGYFFVDVKAACDALGIPVTDEDVANYLSEYLFENDDAPTSSYDRKYGKQPVLWHDEDTGVTVQLVTERHDYDSDTDVDAFFQHDSTSIWGPLPREVRRVSDDKKNMPKLKVIVEPVGNPFAPETTERTDDIVRSYMMKLDK
ncbi:hypothetical protein KDA06_02665 [Candidatus Saccharibacteria bacterium]|jgi:hypothetical protein|nr:hypothetical protein [Candidatus Saccharibacteria bacterium]HPR09577.1 hypothetical protein [Candidatus Saccharibacteria bacterium]